MISKSTIVFLLAVLLTGSLWAADADRYLLAGYDFDDNLAEVGPDTYQIFKHNFGKVGLSSAYKYSGSRALKIQDVAKDGGFPELQGYFKTTDKGKLYFHFALLVADTAEDFNIALAGRSHFRLVKHGIGFWLQNRDGVLHHYVDKHPVELFALIPFVWYLVDLSYDIENGEYDLTIRNEYGEDIVLLKAQQNAVNAAGSTVNKFSFIGDLKDRQNASYYVDDVMVYSQNKLALDDFVAPGRRKLFIDSWNDYHRRLYGKIQCIPGVQITDFGIDIDGFFELVKQGHQELVNRLLENKPVEAGKWQDNHLLSAIYLWQQGCNQLKTAEWQLAIDNFQAAQNLVGNARIYQLSLALAYAGAEQYQQVDNLLAGIQADWVNDQRLAVAYAMVGISRNDTFSASEWLASLAFDSYESDLQELIKPLHAGLIDKNMVAQLKSYAPDDWPHFLQQAVVTEQYYFSLLWQKRYQDAFYYATEVIDKLKKLDIRSSKWHERAGDAAFYGGTNDKAIVNYKLALEINETCYVNYLKLADVYHVTGNILLERENRQHVYGKFEDTY